MTRATINVPIYIDTDSDDAANGYEAAQDAWLSTAQGSSGEDAALKFAQSVMEVAVTGTRDELAAELYGAACLFLEVAGKPVIGEAKS